VINATRGKWGGRPGNAGVLDSQPSVEERRLTNINCGPFHERKGGKEKQGNQKRKNARGVQVVKKLGIMENSQKRKGAPLRGAQQDF